VACDVWPFDDLGPAFRAEVISDIPTLIIHGTWDTSTPRERARGRCIVDEGDAGRSDADDLPQETFWRAYRHITTFQARGRFLSWLFRIAFQVFINDRRTRRFVPEPLPTVLESPVNEVESTVSRLTFEQLMMHLSPGARAAIVLHYQHGMSHAEIAEALDLPLGTVKTLIRRGRQTLQKTFRRGQGN